MEGVKIKICGIRTRADVNAVNAVRPDYIGFVFAESVRRIGELEAEQLRDGLHSDISAVGVFVNEEPERIIRLCRRGIIDIIQLHGSEDAGYISKIRSEVPNRIIKAKRISNGQIPHLKDEPDCDYLLFDTYVKDAYGGSGKSFDWSLIPKTDKPFFLAGGINSINVMQAIAACRPYCIDVSSGVETGGVKDAEKIRELVTMVRSLLI